MSDIRIRNGRCEMTIEEAKTEWLELGDRFDAWKRNGIDPSDDDSYTPYMEACLDRWDDLLAFANGKNPDIVSREEWEKTCPPRDVPED